MLGRVERRPSSSSNKQDRVKKTIQTQVRIVSASAATTVLTVTFDQPVVLRGTPKWTTDLPGVTAVSAEATSLNVVEITFSASIATAAELVIPVGDPAIRSKVGGFVADTTFPV